jgi:hypothetical protein
MGMLIVWRFDAEEKDCSGTVKTTWKLPGSFCIKTKTTSELNMFEPGKLGSIVCNHGGNNIGFCWHRLIIRNHGGICKVVLI